MSDVLPTKRSMSDVLLTNKHPGEVEATMYGIDKDIPNTHVHVYQRYASVSVYQWSTPSTLVTWTSMLGVSSNDTNNSKQVTGGKEGGWLEIHPPHEDEEKHCIEDAEVLQVSGCSRTQDYE